MYRGMTANDLPVICILSTALACRFLASSSSSSPPPTKKKKEKHSTRSPILFLFFFFQLYMTGQTLATAEGSSLWETGSRNVNHVSLGVGWGSVRLSYRWSGEAFGDARRIYSNFTRPDVLIFRSFGYFNGSIQSIRTVGFACPPTSLNGKITRHLKNRLFLFPSPHLF